MSDKFYKSAAHKKNKDIVAILYIKEKKYNKVYKKGDLIRPGILFLEWTVKKLRSQYPFYHVVEAYFRLTHEVVYPPIQKCLIEF